MKATLTRLESTDQGTFGVFKIEQNGRSFSCQSLELPWRNNQREVSCIPEGEYECIWRSSTTFGRKLYAVTDVNGRSGILFHVGNYAGDVKKGYRSDVRGCILLGESRGTLRDQSVVLTSKNTMRAFHGFTQGENFLLCVTRGNNE
jgi:hypothetical protein